MKVQTGLSIPGTGRYKQRLNLPKQSPAPRQRAEPDARSLAYGHDDDAAAHDDMTHGRVGASRRDTHCSRCGHLIGRGAVIARRWMVAYWITVAALAVAVIWTVWL